MQRGRNAKLHFKLLNQQARLFKKIFRFFFHSLETIFIIRLHYSKGFMIDALSPLIKSSWDNVSFRNKSKINDLYSCRKNLVSETHPSIGQTN